MRVRVLVVWEPILPTDWSRPSGWVQSRISDPRVAQFWDREHLVAGELRRHFPRSQAAAQRKGILWDLAVLYGKQAQCADRNRHHNDGVFFVALVNIMVSDFPSPNETQGARLSSHTQTCERCASRSATLVRQNPQFKHCHVGELHGVVLSLPHRQRWAEIPLLANNFSEGTPVIR